MADQASLSIDGSAELARELAQREAELDILTRVQQGLASRLEVQAIYDLVGDGIRDFFNAQVVMISTYDAETGSVEHRFAIERGERVYAPGRFPPGGFRAQVVATRQPLLVNRDVAAEAARRGQPTLPGTITPKSWLGVPMLVGDQVTGILSMQNVETEDAFDASDVRLLQAFASSASIALDNAHLFAETQRLLKESEQRTRELQMINRVLEGLAQELDMASVYELVGAKIREIYEEADLTIAVYDAATDLLTAPYLVEGGRRVALAPFKVGGKGFIGHLLQSPHTLLINEQMAQVAAQYEGVDVTGAGMPKSALYVPLAMGRSMRGEIVLVDMQREHAFSESDVRVLEAVAHSLSVALETARLREQEKKYLAALEHEFEVGRRIQAGFLPAVLPQPAGWEIAAWLQPAREVAGDFYDVFELPDGTVGLVTGDVCDKGLGAALFMTLFRSFVRAASNIGFYARARSAGGESPADRLRSAITLTGNYIAETHGETGMFATLFFGILDPRTGVLTYVNAGHRPPLLLGEQGPRQALRRTGPALGVALDADYAIGAALIEPGETLFAYTDGLVDAASPAGESFGEKRLSALLVGGRALSPLLAAIREQVAGHSAGAAQFDDITVLAARRAGQPPGRARTILRP